MRFFALSVLAIAVTVSAQNSTTSTGASSTSTSLSPQATCLQACADSDICCQAACVGVPCPSDLQANQTTTCASQCVQGNGTQAETDAYAKCQQSCVSSYFLTATTGAAAAATGGSSTTGSYTFGSSSTATGSGTARQTGSSTASGSSSSSTSNGAPETRAFIAGAGLFGLIVAGLAL